jgi:hypothetical protein
MFGEFEERIIFIEKRQDKEGQPRRDPSAHYHFERKIHGG